MAYLFSFILMLILIGFLILRKGKRPYKHKNISQQDLKKYFKVLLFRGYDRGILCIEINEDNRFLQFTKYIAGKDSVGLQCGFPLADWSKDYYELLKETLDERGIVFEIQKTGREGVSEFLIIDLKQDLDFASNLTKLILQSIYELDESRTVDLYFENVSPKEEKIGFGFS